MRAGQKQKTCIKKNDDGFMNYWNIKRLQMVKGPAGRPDGF
jgi:hypothetical protein